MTSPIARPSRRRSGDSVGITELDSSLGDVHAEVVEVRQAERRAVVGPLVDEGVREACRTGGIVVRADQKELANQARTSLRIDAKLVRLRVAEILLRVAALGSGGSHPDPPLRSARLDLGGH